VELDYALAWAESRRQVEVTAAAPVVDQRSTRGRILDSSELLRLPCRAA